MKVLTLYDYVYLCNSSLGNFSLFDHLDLDF